VWPALQLAFADAETALTAASQRAQEAALLATEAAAADLPALQDGAALRVPALRQLLQHAPGRCRNALQAWLAQQLPQGDVPQTLPARLLQELPAATAAQWPAPGGALRLYRGRLTWAADAAPVAPAALAPSAAPAASSTTTTSRPSAPAAIDLSQPGSWPVDGSAGVGHFEVLPTTQGGVPAQLLRQLVLHPRSGGERFATGPKATPRSLKKQYQAAGLPAWQRQGPLLSTTDGRLVFVPGLGFNAWALGEPGQARVALRWLPGKQAQPAR
jgi:tRNA(Ile)-lysidine synthase